MRNIHCQYNNMKLFGTSCLVIVCLIQILFPVCKSIQCDGKGCCDIDVTKSNLTKTLCCDKDGCDGYNGNPKLSFQNYLQKGRMINRLKDALQKLGGR
uniref:Venom protein n=1 Tax=Schistosoma mansoni TaxID=6183 RepID=A0A5K4F9Q5_SCHMA